MFRNSHSDLRVLPARSFAIGILLILALPVQAQQPQGISPQSYGAKGDGVADDGAALGAACVAAKSAATTMALSGTYRIAAGR
jgi:hypothetical protein